MNDHGFIPLGKYSSARDSILHFLCVGMWSNDSTGDVESPTGYVWRISNNWEEVKPINMEINSVLEEWFTENSEVTDSPELRLELVGHFLVVEDSNGFISVHEYATKSLVLSAFESLEGIFNEWNNEDEEN